MKKISVFLFLLLSICLWGCSAPAAEMNESAPSAPKEAVAPETEAPAAEASDDSQSLAPKEEEPITTTDGDYYSIATDMSSAVVENYATQIKQQFLQHDWPAISEEIAYPITISGITYNNSTEFLAASKSFDSSLDEAFFEALEEEDCKEMFCSWQGIMLGETGQIWIGEVLDEENASQGLMITAVNDLLKNQGNLNPEN